MSQTMVEIVALLIACAIAAGALMWRYRAYMQALSERQAGETFWQAFQRGAREHALNEDARMAMMGGRIVTWLATTTAVVLTACTLIGMLHGKWPGYVAGAYLAVGFVVSSRLNLRKHRQWARLGLLARQELRWTHAWLWPMHMASLRRSSSELLDSTIGADSPRDKT